MPRLLLENDVAGLPAWSWTTIWFGCGILIGVVVTVFLCTYFRSRKQETYTATQLLPSLGPGNRGSPVLTGVGKTDIFSGSLAESTGYCGESHSLSHWRQHPTRTLDTVIEGEGSTMTPGIVSPSLMKHSSPGGKFMSESSQPTLHSPINDETITVPIDPVAPNALTITKHPATRENSPLNMRYSRAKSPHSSGQQSSVGFGSAYPTSNSVSTVQSISGQVTSGAAGQLPSGPLHTRNTSTVSSIGASPEYEEDDLDDDWRVLLDEVNLLLSSKQHPPIRNARERATVVNSLLVSTSTRDRSECVRNAAIDMLTFRKMHSPSD